MEIVRDWEGNSYRTIRVGNQVWMAENLRCGSFNDGQPISQITDNYEWQNNGMPACCTYGNLPINLSNGLLYNWFCVGGQQSICPDGWKIPSVADWEILLNHYGGVDADLSALLEADGFNIGLFGARHGTFEGMGTNVAFWTSDKESGQPQLPPPGQTASAVKLVIHGSSLIFQNTNEYQIEGFYLRCLKK